MILLFFFFLEPGEDVQFNPIEIAKLGTVPQVFGVVQPVKDLYRVGFFSNLNIKQFGPNTPARLLKAEEMKDLVLTKLHNGLVMCNACPPMNRLFYVPRKETIDSIIAKFPKRKQQKKKMAHFLKKTQQPQKPTTENQSIIASFVSFSEWSDLSLHDTELFDEEPPIQPRLVNEMKDNLSFMLTSFLESLGLDNEKRNSLVRDILQASKESATAKQLESQISTFRSIAHACQTHIDLIVRNEGPIALIQRIIRLWNVHHYMPCRLNYTSAWINFRETEQTFSLYLDCIVNFYKKPLMHLSKLNQLTKETESLLPRLFFGIEELYQTSRRLLSKLDVVFNYYPIIFGIGNIFKEFRVHYERTLTAFILNFPLMIDAWDVTVKTYPDLLVALQKDSTCKNIPLSTLFIKVIEHTRNYAKFIGVCKFIFLVF